MGSWMINDIMHIVSCINAYMSKDQFIISAEGLNVRDLKITPSIYYPSFGHKLEA